MLNYKILENKSTIKTDNNEYIDLLSDSFIKDSNNEIISGYPIIINKYYVARPDLISLMIYGDDRYADIICKINGISNPFELNEDDIIYIPSIDYITKCTQQKNNSNDLITNESDTYMEIQNDNIYQKTVNSKRSPNQQVVGESNYVIDKSLGIVFY